MHLASVAGIVTDAEMPASAKSMTIFAWTRDSPVRSIHPKKEKPHAGSEGRANKISLRRAANQPQPNLHQMQGSTKRSLT